MTQTAADATVAQHTATVSLPSSIHASIREYAEKRQKFGFDASISEINTSALASSDEVLPVPGAPLVAVSPFSSAGTGTGLMLTQNVTGAHTLIEAPPQMQFRVEDSDIFDIVPKDDPCLALAIVLLHELSKGRRSQWSSYLSSLPRSSEMHQPQFWSEVERMQLRGCGFWSGGRDIDKDEEEDEDEDEGEGEETDVDGVSRFFDVEQDYEYRVRPFIERYADSHGFDLSVCSRGNFEMCIGWILSRGFRPGGAAAYPSTLPILVPIVDFFNTTSLDMLERDVMNDGEQEHDVQKAERQTINSAADGAIKGRGAPAAQALLHRRCINAEKVWVPTPSSSSSSSSSASPGLTLQIRTLPHASLAAGSQLFIPYGVGPLPNSALLCRYGFIEDSFPRWENEHDEVMLDAKDIVQLLRGPNATGKDDEDEEEEGNGEDAARSTRRQAETTAQAAITPVKNAQPNNKRKRRASSTRSQSRDTRSTVSTPITPSSSSSSSPVAPSSRPPPSSHEVLSILPRPYFLLPSNGLPPIQLEQFVAALLGHIPLDSFRKLVKEWKNEVENHRSEPPLMPQTDVTPVQQRSAEHVSTSPSPPPIQHLTVSPDASSSSPDSPHSSSVSYCRLEVSQSLFLLFHHRLTCFGSSLEDDVKLRNFFQTMQQQRIRAWRAKQEERKELVGKNSRKDGEHDASSSTSTAPPAPSTFEIRRDLALRMRMIEKRILYRAIECVSQRIRSLSAARDSMENAVDEKGVEPRLSDESDDSEFNDNADNSFSMDPATVNPALYRKVNTSGAKDGAGSSDSDVHDSKTEKASTSQVSSASGATSTPSRFTYTKRTSTSDRPWKRRR